MKCLISISIFLISLFGCLAKQDNAKTLPDSTKRKLPIIDTGKFQTYTKDSIVHITLPDFLGLSHKAYESYKGYLQGVNKSDSSGPYVIRRYISDSLSFDLIFFPKTLNKDAIGFEDIEKADSNGYKDYLCFAFVYPMKKFAPASKYYHSDNTPYPVTIKSYVKRVNMWNFISKKKVKDLNELSQYKIQTMYGIAQ